MIEHGQAEAADRGPAPAPEHDPGDGGAATAGGHAEPAATRGASSSPAATALALSGAPRAWGPRDEETRRREGAAYARATHDGAPVNAAAYLQSFQRTALREIGDFLRTRPITTGHPELQFIAGSPLEFLDRLGRELAVGDGRDVALRLGKCLEPTDLLALVDRNRPLSDTRRSYLDLMAAAGGTRFDDGDPYNDGPLGPRVWQPPVAIAIAAALEARLTESMARMAGRYVALAERKRQAAVADGGFPAPVTASELVPSHPFDWYVARAFTEAPPTVEPAGGALHPEPGAQVDYRRVREVEWLPPPAPWNAVRPVQPARASREAMAARLLGAPTEAHRLIQVGDYFVVPEELAARFPEAVRHRPAAGGGDAVHALATGARAGEVAAAEAPAPTASVRHGEVEALWTRVDEQLRGIALVASKLPGHELVTAAVAAHQATRATLAALDPAATASRAEALRGQAALLEEIAAEVADLTAVLARQGDASASEGFTAGQRARLSSLLRAASLSHLPSTGRAALAEVRASDQAQVLAAMEAQFADAVGQLAAVKQVRSGALVQVQRSADTFGASLDQRRDELRTELAVMAAKLRSGTADAESFRLLYAKLDGFRVEVTLIAGFGAVEQVLGAATELEDSNWVAATGGIDELESVRGAGRRLQLGLGKVLRIRREAEGNVLALRRRIEAGDRDPALVSAAQQIALSGVEQIKAELSKLGGDEAIRTFLQKAYDTLHDTQKRALIAQLAVMIGVTIAVTVISAGVGDLAAGAVVGLGGRGALVVGADMVAQSLTMTAIMTKVQGGSFGSAFAEDLATNLAMVGALHGFERVFAGTRLGAKAVEAGQRGYYLAKVGELTGRTLAVAGAMYAVEQAKSRALHGHWLSEEEHEQLAIQGMAQVVGMAVVNRLLKTPKAQLRALGARGGGILRQHAELRALARSVAKHPDPVKALELMRSERAALEAELAAWQELSTLSPAELHRRGVEPEVVEAMTGNVGRHLNALDQLEGGTLPAQLGLEAVVPGRVFSGPQAKVDAVVASYRRAGSEVTVHAEGDGGYRYHVTGRDGLTVELLAHQPGGPRQVGRARAGEVVDGVHRGPSGPSRPRPVEHVEADLARASGKAALTVGGATVAGAHELRLTDGAEGVPVTLHAAALAEGELSRVQVVDGAVAIEVSTRASALEVEREVARRLTEGSAMVARLQAGKEASSPDALGKGATGTFLSPADQGRVAELRVLRRQHAEAVAAEGASSKAVAELEHSIDALERALRIVDSTPAAQRRRRMVETQVIVQNDRSRRAEARSQLDGERGHPGIELHNHFMGVVDTEVFRRKADVAANGKDTGSWLPLLGRLAAMKQYAHEERAGGGIGQRGVGGDAFDIADRVLAQVQALEISVERASAADQAAMSRRVEAMAEDAARAALTATDDTDFNSAYELRDQLVKDTFAGGLRPGAFEDEKKAHASFGYDQYTREALLRLARDGITYTEQSNSAKKLGEQFGQERVARIHAELVASGELAPGQLDLRFLSMIPARAFGERGDAVHNPEERHPPRPDDGAFTTLLGKSGEPVSDRADTVGRDIAGAELYDIDGLGKERLQSVYRDLRARADARGEPTVFRPHVGEGAVDNLVGQPFQRDRARQRTADGDLTHQARARHNLEQMLLALEELQARGELDPQKVIVRFGHATMATPAQIVRMRALGVLAELNLGSNVRTGSADQTVGGVDGMTSPVEQYDDHVFGTAIYYGVDTLLSTDGHDVMRTTMRDEYQRANRLLEEILAGERKVRVRAEDAGDRGVAAGSERERWLAIEELTADERTRFLRGYEKLYADAQAYYQHRPRPDGRGGTAGLDAHWLGLAQEHGLDRTAVGAYEGSRAQVVATAEAYRKRGDLVMYDESDAGALRVRVTTADGRAEVELHERSTPSVGGRPGGQP